MTVGSAGPESVFVSSTCYDLLDLRAELRDHLLQLGLIPLISEAPDFPVDATINSIDNCLTNVGHAEVMLTIINLRYGGILNRGYGDISATHLEYNRARDLGKPIHMFVRDRVLAAWELWRNDQKQAPGDPADDFTPLVKQSDADRLFPWILEHARLEKEKPGSNWLHPFSNSVDFRQRVSNQLGGRSERARLQRALEAGRVPLLTVFAALASRRQLRLVVDNPSGGAVTDVEVRVTGWNGGVKHSPVLAAGGSYQSNWSRNSNTQGASDACVVQTKFTNAHGERYLATFAGEKGPLRMSRLQIEPEAFALGPEPPAPRPTPVSRPD